MEHKGISAAVVALMAATLVTLLLLTPIVAASHTPDVTPKELTVKADTPMVLTFTVKNDGPDPIENVRLIVPSGWGLAPVRKVPKDNTLRTVDDNDVIIPAGTVVRLASGENVMLLENTDVIRESGTWVWVPSLGENALLTENGLVEVRGNTLTTADNGLKAGDNVAPSVDEVVTLTTDNELRVLEDTQVIRVTGNIVRLPENTLMEVVQDDNATDFGTDNNIVVETQSSVNLADNRVRTVENVSVKRQGVYVATIGADTNVELLVDNVVIVPVGKIVQLTRTVTVTVPENTDVIRENGKNMELQQPAAAENQPNNWTQATGTSTVPSGDYVEWVGIADNQIASGESLDFPFAVTTPSSTTYTLYVRTKDTVSPTPVQSKIILTVDGTSPTVTVAASPIWTKDNTEVTITVTASESLAKLENVMVAENNAPENTQISMTPNADNTVWTGTYTTGDNKERDGTATIYVIGAQFEDLVGNKGSDAENTFTVDRMVPPTPDLTAILGFPTSPTNVGGWLIEGTAKDNFLGSLTVQENMIVKIRVGSTVLETTSDSSGYFNRSITLTEGIQEVGIQYVDRAGNVGGENADNVTYDGTTPSITLGTIAGETLVNGVWITDNTPTITLTIRDAVLGVDNVPFISAENRGYSVQLRKEDNTPIDNLVNALAHDNNVLEFENAIPPTIGSFTNGLPDGTYWLYVVAGDNLNENSELSVWFRFDVIPPDIDALLGSSIIDPETGLLVKSGATVKEDTLDIVGTADEPGSTVHIYVDTTEKTVVSDETDGSFSTTIDLSEGINKIYVKEVDVAGNESEKKLLASITADWTPPTVTITEPTTGTSTDEVSITVSGKVTDTVADYDELVVQLDATGAYVLKTIYLNPDGSFSTTVPLTEGTNIITVYARDQAGNQDLFSVTVDRSVTSWYLYFMIVAIVIVILAAIAVLRR